MTLRAGIASFMRNISKGTSKILLAQKETKAISAVKIGHEKEEMEST